MIREARREDLPECARVVRRSFRTVADDFGLTEENAPRFTAFAVTAERLAWQAEHEGRLMLLDEDGGVIRGFCSLRPGGDGTCELGNLAVLPEHRHLGIGGRLLDRALDAARALDCSSVTLGIVEENTVLRAWYEGRGAVHTGAVKYDFFPFTCGSMVFRL